MKIHKCLAYIFLCILNITLLISSAIAANWEEAITTDCYTAQHFKDGCRVFAEQTVTGEPSRLSAKLFSHTPSTSLRNVIVVVSGFDPEGMADFDFLFQELNRQFLASDLLSRGYDILLLNFGRQSTDLVQNNALAVTTALERFQVARAGQDRDMAMVGLSLGGVIGRYSLRSQELLGVDHGIDLFISYDSPHRGAYVMPGIQNMVPDIARGLADAEDDLDLFGDLLQIGGFLTYGLLGFAVGDYLDDEIIQQSQFELGEKAAVAGMMSKNYIINDASKQIIIDHISGDAANHRAALLASLGSQGLPTLSKNIAFANGDVFGQTSNFPTTAYQHLINYDYDGDGGEDIRFLVRLFPTVPGIKNFRLNIRENNTGYDFWDKKRFTSSGAAAIDNAPCSTFPWLEVIDNTLGDDLEEGNGGGISFDILTNESPCFIPTVSALDIPSLGYADNIAYMAGGAENIANLSPFDEVYFEPGGGNYEHLAITPYLANALKDEITGRFYVEDVLPAILHILN